MSSFFCLPLALFTSFLQHELIVYAREFWQDDVVKGTMSGCFLRHVAESLRVIYQHFWQHKCMRGWSLFSFPFNVAVWLMLCFNAENVEIKKKSCKWRKDQMNVKQRGNDNTSYRLRLILMCYTCIMEVLMIRSMWGSCWVSSGWGAVRRRP